MSIRVGDCAGSHDFEAFVPGEPEPWRASLDDLRGSWVVLFFYGADFELLTPGELASFEEFRPDFEAEGALVLAAGTDTLRSHEAWFGTHPLLTGVGFPVIANITRHLSKAFGVIGEKGTALHGTFVIDPEGIVRNAAVSEKGTSLEARDALQALRALRAGERALAAATA